MKIHKKTAELDRDLVPDIFGRSWIDFKPYLNRINMKN